jgi:hypothetical protein
MSVKRKSTVGMGLTHLIRLPDDMESGAPVGGGRGDRYTYGYTCVHHVWLRLPGSAVIKNCGRAVPLLPMGCRPCGERLQLKAGGLILSARSGSRPSDRVSMVQDSSTVTDFLQLWSEECR